MASSGRIFLCHNSLDKAQVQEVALALLKFGGVRTWLDQWEIRGGTKWETHLRKAFAESSACLVFMGPNGMGPYQPIEVTWATERGRPDPSYLTIPVILPGTADAGRAALEMALPGVQWVGLQGGWDSPQALTPLLTAIRRHRAGPPAEAIRVAVAAESWQNSARQDKSVLLRGRALTEARELATQPGTFDGLSLEFVAASEVESRRRQRWLVGGLAALTATLAGVALWANDQRLGAISAREAESAARSGESLERQKAVEQRDLALSARRLEAAAREEADKQRANADTQAVRAEEQAAVARKETDRAQELLRENERQLRIERGLRAQTLAQQRGKIAEALTAALGSVETGSNGRLRAENSGYVGLHDAIEALRDGLVLNDAESAFSHAAFSTDSRWLVLVAARSRDLHFFHARSGTYSHAFKPSANDVLQVAFAPPGDKILVLGKESNAIEVYDIQGASLGRIEVPEQRALRRFTLESGGRHLYAWGNGAPRGSRSSLNDPPLQWGPYVYDLKTQARLHAFHGLSNVASAATGTRMLVEDRHTERALIDFDPERVRYFQRAPVEIVRNYAGQAGALANQYADEKYLLDIFHKSAAFSRDAKRVCVGDLDGTITLLSAVDGEQVWTTKPLDDAVTIVHWSLDGTAIAVGFRGGAFAIVDATSGATLLRSGLFDAGPGSNRELMERLDWSPDGKKIFVAWAERDARHLDASTGRPLQRKNYMNTVHGADISPDHSRIVTIDRFGIARLHFSDRFERLWWAKARTGETHQLEFSSDATLSTARIDALLPGSNSAKVVYIVPGKSVELLDVYSSSPSLFRTYGDLACNPAMLSADGTRLFCATRTGSVVRFPTNDPQADAITYAIPQPTGLEEARSRLLQAALHRARARSTSSESAQALNDGAEETAATPKALYNDAEETVVTAMALSKREDFLIVGTSRGDLFKVNLTTGVIEPIFKTKEGRILSVAISDNGRFVAVAGDSSVAYKVGLVQRSEERLPNVLGDLSAVAIVAGDRNIVTAGRDGSINVFRADSCAFLKRFDAGSGPINAIAVSPDGTQLAVAGRQGGIRVFDLKTFELRHQFGLHGEIGYAVVWNKGGNGLTVAGNETARTYDLRLSAIVTEARGWFQLMTGAQPSE